MWNRIICGIVLFSFCNVLNAKEIKYPISEIPAVLKENTHTVMRLYKQEVEIKSEKSVTVNVTEVRTILNKNGEHDCYFVELYDPLNKISNIKGKVYNELGEKIKNLGGDDVVDQSYITGYTLYDDNRIKYLDPKYLTFPFTVEYTYQLDLKQTLFLPEWNHSKENTSYENSIFILKTPKDYSFSYKEYNLIKGGIKTFEDGKDIYTWNLNNLAAKNVEPLTSVSSPNFPLVRLGANKFEVADTKGSSETWKDLGIWVTELIDKKDILSESTKTKMKEITSTCSNDYDKVKVVYEFMQQKTRYVSIQVGIGGWQPFDAETVGKNSYGDCKALANYTKALLTSVGVKSYYTLVNAGAKANKIDETFPSSQFNHVIVCVPIAKDTLWLECTSQRMPCAYNGDFTDDREVLLIDGEKSRLIHSRIYSALENCISRKTTVNLIDDESGEATSKAKYIGLCYEKIAPVFFADDAEKVKILTQSIELPTFTLKKFLITENRSKTPSFEQNLNITFTNYIRKMGDIALLPLNFMNKLTSIPDKVRNRKTAMSIRRSYMENDTVIYQLPVGYQVSEMPDKYNLNGIFGKYSTSTAYSDNKITYIRHFELFKGDFPANSYTDFREFLEQIATADEAVVSLKKTKN
ncbi:MAG: DUF3857 domain-containing protein [Paludibacter sp.]